MIAMRVKKFNSNIYVNIPYNKYKIDWNKAPSKGQKVLQDFLYNYWKNHLVLCEMRIPGTKYRCDLVNCNKKIIMEYSPSHHTQYNKFFHKNAVGWLNAMRRDHEKMEWAEENGFDFVEIVEEDLSKLNQKFFIEKFNVYI